MAEIKICSIDGCGKQVVCFGPSNPTLLCNMHYLRLRRYGRLEVTIVKDPSQNHCGKPCPAARKIWKLVDYLKNKEKYIQRAAKWQAKNPERIAEIRSREAFMEKARARTRKWTTDNPKRKRAMDKKFNEEHRALVTSYKAKRRARERQACPPWLTAEMEAQIRALYAEAERLTRETGIEHEVDHIVPLAGKTVCGLHVPWNLRVITREANNHRPRVWQGVDTCTEGAIGRI